MTPAQAPLRPNRGNAIAKEKSMFRSKLSIAICAAILSTATVSEAALYADLNTYGLFGQLVSSTTPLEDEFNIYEHGFDPTQEHAISGVASFVLIDADKQTEEFTINLGTETDPLDSGNIDDGILNLGWFKVSFELAGGELSGELLGQLNDDGVLEYVITAAAGGSFSVFSAGLVVCTDDGPSIKTNGVPDGGLTLALFGAGLLGLTALRRRL